MLIAVAIASASGMAQEKKSPCKTPEERTEKIMERMKEKLLLSEGQEAKLKPVILKREQQRDEFQVKREALMEANKKTMKAVEDELKTILTSEQNEKLKKEHTEDRGKRKEKRSPEPPAPEQK